MCGCVCEGEVRVRLTLTYSAQRGPSRLTSSNPGGGYAGTGNGGQRSFTAFDTRRHSLDDERRPTITVTNGNAWRE